MEDDPIIAVCLPKSQWLDVVETLEDTRSFSSFNHQQSIANARDMILIFVNKHEGSGET